MHGLLLVPKSITSVVLNDVFNMVDVLKAISFAEEHVFSRVKLYRLVFLDS